MSTTVIKEEAHRLIDQLPANATWDDLMHEIYVREAIEKGLEDSRAGRTKDVTEIRKKYGFYNRIIYHVKAEQIDVIAVIHGAMNVLGGEFE